MCDAPSPPPPPPAPKLSKKQRKALRKTPRERAIERQPQRAGIAAMNQQRFTSQGGRQTLLNDSGIVRRAPTASLGGTPVVLGG